jgi:flagellin
LLNGSFGDASFQIGANSGEAMIMGLTSIRADDYRMGGTTLTAVNGKDSSWSVAPNAADLKFEFISKEGEEVTIDILAKPGDDIEQLATYINGQSDVVNASVGDNGELQIFIAERDIEGDVAISGGLAGELDFSNPGIQTTVQDIDMTTVAGSQNAISVLDSALKYVDAQRAGLGAKQNRLSHSINNLANIQENVEASNSRIKDTDFAKETTAMTKSQILQQAGTSILAQAKQLPNSAMSLLQ